MKIRLLTPSLIVAALTSTIFFSCKKDDPVTPHDPSDSSTVNLKKGLLVYLPFSGNYADSSGNNNPTTALGGVTLSSDRFGTPNTAMSGMGTGQRVAVGNNGSIKFDSAFTFSANVLSRRQHDESFVAMVKRATGKGVTFGVGYGIPGNDNINYTVSNSNATCDDWVSPYNTTTDTSGLKLADSVWYNIVVTFYKGTMKMYANGTLISTRYGASPTVPICPGAEIIIGGWWDYDPQSIDGKMDEVRLYNRALNDQEIAKLAEGFSNPTPPTSGTGLQKGLLVYLPFNGSIADSSGNNNPTQIVGAGAGLTYDMHGYASSAYGSDGTSGRLEVTNNGSIWFDTAFSISLSFMERQVTDRQVFTSFVNVATGYGPTFLLGNSMPGAYNVWFGNATSAQTCSDYGNANDHHTTDTTNFIPQAESWYNITATFLNGRQRIYVNGQLISEKWASDPHTFICPTAKLVIGGWWDNDPIPINGKIDNFRLYNRALTTAEIAELAQYYQPTTNAVRQIVTRG